MSRPWLDVSDVILDPMFNDNTMTYTRLAQTVGADGLSVETPTTSGFNGVVTSVSGSVLHRVAEGEHITDTVLIHTMTRLTDGQMNYTADIVTWSGVTWTVTNVNSYSQYGAGFIAATCTLIPLSGSPS